jgi:hypothetical protein
MIIPDVHPLAVSPLDESNESSQTRAFVGSQKSKIFEDIPLTPFAGDAESGGEYCYNSYVRQYELRTMAQTGDAEKCEENNLTHGRESNQ